MSDTLPEGQAGPHSADWRRRKRSKPFTVAGLPEAQDLAVAHERHKGDDADRFTLYTPEQIMQETRSVRLDISFDDVIKVRDQAEMIIAAMRGVIDATRRHDIGSIRQRIDARREAASCGAALTLFNGRVPYGYSKKPRRKT